jgi:hypothetical protein
MVIVVKKSVNNYRMNVFEEFFEMQIDLLS